MNIISQIKINGQWVNQDQIPEQIAKDLLRKAVIRGMEHIGFSLDRDTEEKTA